MKEKTLVKCHFFLMAAVTLLMLFACVSCSDDSSNFNYQTMLASRADIVGAQSLILSHGAQTRADDDEYYAFQEAGLYKVDEDGNVSAVGIFMSEEGSTREKEGRIIPRYLTKLNDRFILLTSCEIKFDDETYERSLDYDIIVDLTTGKIYKFDEFRDAYYSRQVSDSRFLIWGKYNKKILGELNMDGNATYRQLTNDEGKGFINPNYYNVGGYVSLLANGVILSQSYSEGIDFAAVSKEMGILYPNKGYDYLQDHEKEFMADNVDDRSHYWHSFVLKDKAAIVDCYYENGESSCPRTIVWSFIEFGNTPNDIKVIPTDKLILEHEAYLSSCQGYYETDNNIIIVFDGYDARYKKILIFNKQTNRLSEFTPSFSENMSIYPYAYYKGRVWDIFTDEGAQGVKVLWINPDTRESGSFDLDLLGVDVDKIERYYDLGKVILYGTRRSDGAYVVATLDLETEKTKIEFSLPKQETVTLIPLN